MVTTVEILIDPVGKGRPRFTRDGHAYTPAKTRSFEERVGIAYSNARGRMYTGAVMVEAWFCMPIPASWSKKKREDAAAHRIYPMLKPDIDNLLKALLDGLNGLAYADDKQVVSVICYKQYSERGKIMVRISDVGDA